MGNNKTENTQNQSDTDAVWGAAAIGAEINRTASQVRYLYSIGALKGAVSKLGHKTMVGSRTELRRLHLRDPP
jgi:hypothetical protein